MRHFPYITVGKILEMLKKENCPITRMTFRRLEKEGLFLSKRTAGGWRVYSPQDAALIIELILNNYGKKTNERL